MSSPIQFININAFLSYQFGIASNQIADVFGSAHNVWMDQYGRIRQIEGYQKQNASAITSNGAANAVRLIHLIPYTLSAGSSTVYRLVGIFQSASEYEIWYSDDDGVNWTFLQDNGAPGTGSLTNFITDSTQFGDVLYLTSSASATTLAVPRKLSVTTMTTAGRTQSPTITASAGAAGALTGNYQWKLLSMIGNARQAGSVASASLALTAQKGSLAWTADANGSVTGYELYRTTATGSTYYFVTYIDLRVTAAYTDNTTDLTILQNRAMQEHGDPPPATALCEAHKQRMWYARSVSNPTRAWFSDPNLPEDVYTQNYLDFTDQDTAGDRISAMIGDFQGNLVVFTEKAIWNVSGTGQILNNIVTDWNKTRTPAGIGAVSHRAVVKIPAGAYYTDETGTKVRTKEATIAYLTSVGDIRIFDGSDDTVISAGAAGRFALDYFKSISAVTKRQSWAQIDYGRSEVAWSFPYSDTGWTLYQLVWNYQWGVWYTRDYGTVFAHSIIKTNAAGTKEIMLAGEGNSATGGFCYKVWDGYLYMGAAGAIASFWSSKSLYPRDDKGEPIWRGQQRWRWTQLMFSTDSAGSSPTVTVAWAPAYARGYGTTPPGITAGSNTTTYTIGTTNDSATKLVKLKNTTTGRYLHDPGIIIALTVSNAGGRPWVLEGMSVAYQTMAGNQRGMQ